MLLNNYVLGYDRHISGKSINFVVYKDNRLNFDRMAILNKFIFGRCCNIDMAELWRSNKK